ncbi:helix-turn-helix domain-containing protein [Halobium palmae]|uniref:Helix-turn-helix domain-containing protein n=1 Tax=Halobium palmae TaxID=1776492 RepID=A0ABD5RXJ9_9EURY
MTVLAEFTIDSSEFILGQVLALDPHTHVEIERVVPASRRVMPYIWVHGGDLERFEEEIQASSHVRELTALDRVDGSALYRVGWEEQVESLIHGMAETDATILEANGNDVWSFRIRFDNHSGLTEFHNYCMDHDIKFQLDRVYTLAEEQKQEHEFELTPAQREAVILAVERGYFEIPREVALAELADELDISEQALSERIRRAVNKVLKSLALTQSVSDLK